MRGRYYTVKIAVLEIFPLNTSYMRLSPCVCVCSFRWEYNSNVIDFGLQRRQHIRYCCLSIGRYYKVSIYFLATCSSHLSRPLFCEFIVNNSIHIWLLFQNAIEPKTFDYFFVWVQHKHIQMLPQIDSNVIKWKQICGSCGFSISSNSPK